MGAEVVEFGRDPAVNIVAHQLGRNAQRIRHAGGIGAAMALHDDAVEPEEHRAVVVVGIEVNLHHVHRRPRQQEASLGTQRAGE